MESSKRPIIIEFCCCCWIYLFTGTVLISSFAYLCRQREGQGDAACPCTAFKTTVTIFLATSPWNAGTGGEARARFSGPREMQHHKHNAQIKRPIVETPRNVCSMLASCQLCAHTYHPTGFRLYRRRPVCIVGSSESSGRQAGGVTLSFVGIRPFVVKCNLSGNGYGNDCSAYGWLSRRHGHHFTNEGQHVNKKGEERICRGRRRVPCRFAKKGTLTKRRSENTESFRNPRKNCVNNHGPKAQFCRHRSLRDLRDCRDRHVLQVLGETRRIMGLCSRRALAGKGSDCCP